MDPYTVYHTQEVVLVRPYEPAGDEELMQWRLSLYTIDRVATDIWTHVPPSTAATARCPDGAANYKKKKKKRKPTRGGALSAQDTTDSLRLWIQQRRNLYPTTEEKTCFANAVGITLVQVHTFCSNYRKRFGMVDDRTLGYKEARGLPGRS
ncbi:hypothetical protein T484DRAFT_1755043 [Baffinella frigidus]|nr:hypothetical protein T484DRAFT_1755043 [Cryptophyta sp. CCMP2293]